MEREKNYDGLSDGRWANGKEEKEVGRRTVRVFVVYAHVVPILKPYGPNG